MLDTTGKQMEQLLRSRLQAAIAAVRDLLETVRIARDQSTIDAMWEVVVRFKEQKTHFTKWVILILSATFYVKNAFNLAS